MVFEAFSQLGLPAPVSYTHLEAYEANIAFAEVGWQDGVRASLELLDLSLIHI